MLIKSIGESKSKQQEDEIVVREIEVLKQRISAPKIPEKLMKEYILRMVFIEMLGHDASFGYIHAVNLTNSSSLPAKRIGYLGVTLTLHSEHELMLLLVNTLQKDLKSSNYIEVSLALHAASKLISKELIPAVIGPVGECLSHKHCNVRKKAAMAMQKFYKIDPESCTGYLELSRKLLSDKDPSVMGAALHWIHDLIVENPQGYKDLVPGFVSILKQIADHRLPRDYDYHRLPAPWIQMKILEILASLVGFDRENSEKVYPILMEILKRSDIGTNAGNAILYECVKTITSVVPDQRVLEEAVKCVSRFITSEQENIRYLGIDALANIVHVDPKYALEHQLVVIDCLEDKDESIRRKSLMLLIEMTNSENVVVITEKLLTSLKSTNDLFLRKELVQKVSQLAENHAPDSFWYFETLFQTISIAPKIVSRETVHELLSFLSNSDETDEETGKSLKQYVAEIAMDTAGKLTLSDTVVKVLAWILGEFGHLDDENSPSAVLSTLADLLRREYDDAAETKQWIVAAMTKQAAWTSVDDDILEVVQNLTLSANVELQQKAYEFIGLVKVPKIMQQALPREPASHPIMIDPKLSFLEHYVSTALKNGARPYSPPENDEFEGKVTGRASTTEDTILRYQPYAIPQSAPIGSGSTTVPELHRKDSDGEGQLKIRVRTRKWGPEGYNDGQPKVEETVASKLVEKISEPVFEMKQEVRPKPLVEKPIVLSEKEKLASALFSGVSTSQSKSRFGRSRGRKAQSQEPSITKSITPPTTSTSPSIPLGDTSEIVDLLDFNYIPSFDPVENPVSSSAPNAPASGHEALPPDLLDRIGGFDRSSELDIEIGRNESIALSFYKIWMPQQTLFCLFVSNLTNAALKNVLCSFNIPKAFKVGYDGESNLTLKGKDALITVLEPFQSTPVLLSLYVDSSHAPTFDEVIGNVSIDASNLSFPVSIGVEDFLRPFQMDTKTFASNWKSSSAEKRFQLPEGTDGEVFLEKCCDQINFYLVQTIGKEHILAAYLTKGDSGTQTPVLLHIKRSANVSIILRSPSINISEALQSLLCNLQ